LWLARVFAERESPPAALATGAAEALLLYAWPKNVRELEMTIAAASIRAGSSRIIQRAHLPETVAPRDPTATGSRVPPPIDLVVPRDRPPSVEDLRLVLERCEGSVARVAEYFGKDRKQVYRWLERAEIDPANHRG
jgi:transcriptional regulator of acetoin/glycerol metabolism